MEGTGGSSASSAAKRWLGFWKLFQYYLDKSTPHTTYRWVGTLVTASIYVLRVFYLQGFYIVSFVLAIFLLDRLVAFLTPLDDPELEPSDGPSLPITRSDEFKPFIPGMPEFTLWYSFTTAICIAFVMTFFSVFDVPVFWQLLVWYCIILLVFVVWRQIAHMIKYKYIPFNFGKQKYSGKKSSPSSSGTRAD